jgi:hypothetical protein
MQLRISEGYGQHPQSLSAAGRPRRFGDLISYQNDRKYSTAIVGKVEIA